jgi:hypothetical protein
MRMQGDEVARDVSLELPGCGLRTKKGVSSETPSA